MESPIQRPAVAVTSVLLGLSFTSGCSALIYEIAWFQQLGLVLGNSAISIAILLASFMGGMCIGGLSAGGWMLRRIHPLKAYALLEFGMAVFGIATIWLFPFVGRIYCDFHSAGAGNWIARSIVASALMCPSTILMGATLPTISRWCQSTREGMSWIGWYQAANTLGAVAGCLTSGLYLLSSFDIQVATLIAAAINLIVAMTAWLLNSFQPAVALRQFAENVPVSTDDMIKAPLRLETEPALSDLFFIYLAMMLSGFTALGAEVIWTRQLGLLFGPTAYSFSIILAVFLSGLALGSAAGAVIGRHVRSPHRMLVMAQLLLGLAIPSTAFLIVNLVPHWLVLRGTDELFTVRITRDLMRSLVVLIFPTFLWGATFSLATACLASRTRDAGRMIGNLSAANTFGAIAGALSVSLLAVPLGSQFVHRGLIIVSTLSAALLLMIINGTRREKIVPRPSANDATGTRRGTILLLSVMALLISIAWLMIPALPNEVLADGRMSYRWKDPANYVYVAEGLDSSIVISDLQDGTRCFHVAGKVEASTRERDIRTQRLLGHLPALAHSSPKKVLVIGCGSGMTAGSFLAHPTVEQIVICEMEKCVIEAARATFGTHNREVLNDPRTRIVLDDARHFLATTQDEFDIITADPIHPWVKGSATLYTTEFFQSCRERLSEEGIMTLWVPLYESNSKAVQCELATFLGQFPQSTIWSGQGEYVGYDLVVVGTKSNTEIVPETLISQMAANTALQSSLAEAGIHRMNSLLDRFVCHGRELTFWLRDAPQNRDINLRLQYLAGASSDGGTEQQILNEMLSTRDRERERTVPSVAADPQEMD